MSTTTRRRAAALALLPTVALAASAVAPGSAQAAPAELSTAPVYSWWDDETVIGTSRLVRTDHGITAVLRTSGIPAGHAVTLWAMYFNAPGSCSTSPCSIPADVFAPTTGADFAFLGGHVVGRGGTTTFAGHLRTGDAGPSGKAELAAAGVAPVTAVPLEDARDAEVVLALHDHGPALTGEALHDQLSSFLGGCEVFNGPNGFASGPGDVPDAAGECSTFARALHR